jgi:hypothetical protein
MGARFAADEKAKRRPLDEAYATAMREVWQAHLGDADIAAWFADAMMMLRPGDLWKKNGEAQPGTEEVLAARDARSSCSWRARRAALWQVISPEPHQPVSQTISHVVPSGVSASQAWITPPPRQTSPSYSTADCPGVTAHCGALKSSAKLLPLGASRAQGASAWAPACCPAPGAGSPQ